MKPDDASPTAPYPLRALEVRDLALARGGLVLFENLSFSLQAGQALLLRGRNGAGKTSLLLALSGDLAPLNGTISVKGRDAESGPDFGILSHRAGIKPRAGVRETLRFWRDVNGAGAIEVEEALEWVGLAGLGDLETGHLSAGQVRRLALARLLVSDRPVWLLDEPLAALDQDGEALLTALLERHLLRGGLLVAATHQDIVLKGVSSLTLGGVA